jgi:hypothetical protein
MNKSELLLFIAGIEIGIITTTMITIIIINLNI